MAGLATLFGTCRPLADVPLAGQAATTVVATVALAPLFAGTAQVFVQPPAATFVSPDVPVDGLVADRQHAVALQPGGDLLRTPQVRKQALDQAEVVAGESPIAPRTRAMAACAAISLAGPIGAIVAAVATNLSRDAAGVPPQHTCDLRGIAPLRSQGCEHIPLSRGDLAIRHGDDSLLAGKVHRQCPRSPHLDSRRGAGRHDGSPRLRLRAVCRCHRGACGCRRTQTTRRRPHPSRQSDRRRLAGSAEAGCASFPG